MNDKGYITGITILLIIIPLIILLLLMINVNQEITNTTTNKLESNEITEVTTDLNNNMEQITQKTLSETIITVITSKKQVPNSKELLIENLQKNVNDKTIQYSINDIKLNCTINDIKPSDNPFKLKIIYTIISQKSNHENPIINTKETQEITITNNEYPIIDPLPYLKTDIRYDQEKFIEYDDNLMHYLQERNIANFEVYFNSVSPNIIKKCSYQPYTTHIHNNNTTLINCLENKYYHQSSDGACILCRLEGKATCSHYGIECFIQPKINNSINNSPTSIDHVIFNDSMYNGDKIIFNQENNSFLYLDNGHRQKYGY
ncbi:MAG: hypothetical protein Q4Q23_01090 [Methanobacteriaceae archaeon]|nr:hypothetical protein [Methanobacteriaceae archaeon]